MASAEASGARPSTPGASGVGAAADRSASARDGTTALRAGESAGELIVLYDGVCGLCDRLVRFLLPRDRRRRLRFAALQGPFAAAILGRHGVTLPEGDPASIVLVEAPGTPLERLSFRSTAALTILGVLPGLWGALGFLRVVPRPLRDFVYDRVARSRYRLFGKLDACPVPSPEDRARFLD